MKNDESYYNSSSVCVCVPYLRRGPLMDLRQTWWVYVGWPPICPWGVLFRKGQWVDGSTGHFCFPLYYVCASLTSHAATAPFAWQEAESNSTLFCCCAACQRRTSVDLAIAIEGSFSKRSTGRWVNGSTGHFHFTILYMIADDASLTPPCCKKHTAYDDTRLMPHRCKKHTVSFARSTGKFPSTYKLR